ncbi:Hsp20/alpha crystallin family protein [Pseudonocardia thermophila]|nr:Hsp20/alpha crystallin family protein [Pseudonocardia thermophila]
MLMRTDAFHELDRLAEQALGVVSAFARPSAMPMDAWRDGDTYVLAIDLPGVDPSAIDVSVEQNTLTVKAERPDPTTRGDVEMQVAERHHGSMTRQLFLDDGLDTERIDARYDAGVLTLRIPVAEKAKPRRIAINAGPERAQIDA